MTADDSNYFNKEIASSELKRLAFELEGIECENFLKSLNNIAFNATGKFLTAPKEDLLLPDSPLITNTHVEEKNAHHINRLNQLIGERNQWHNDDLNKIHRLEMKLAQKTLAFNEMCASHIKSIHQTNGLEARIKELESRLFGDLD